LSKIPSRWHAVFGALILAVVVFFVYASSLSTGFFADDYNFLEPVARLDLADYLIRYFDPRVQTLWYRPLQGVQILVEWKLFGANPVGYHVVNILFHAINCALLFALVARVSQKRHLAFAAALLYATFPVYALAVNWINITDPLATIFYLLGLWFWWSFLHRGRLRDALATHILFILGVLTKQMVITLPAILFLIDRLLAHPSARIASFNDLLAWLEIPRAIRRYGVLVLIMGFFAGIQYATRSTHTFAGVFGYGLGAQTLSILIQYLSLAVFPWGYFLPTDTQFTEGMPFSETWNLIWLALALFLYLFVMLRARSRALLFLALAWLIAIFPVLPFPFIELRYLYLPAMVSGIVFALWFDAARAWLERPRWFAAFAFVAAIFLVLGSAASIANANAGIFEIARQRRVPFRDIERAHPTFPADTRLYFIDPVTPISELSGMFALRYGSGVTVGGNDSEYDHIARLREHANALVYYFDETGKPREIPVEPAIAAQSLLPLPLDFAAPIRLEGYELPRAAIRRGDALIVLLYWRATGKIEKDFTVFVHLLDQNGKRIEGYDSPPRGGGAPTSAWQPGVLIVDAVVMTVPPETMPGSDYRVIVGLYEFPSLARLPMLDARGQPIADALTLAPLSIVEK
jgi:hypothetical protein